MNEKQVEQSTVRKHAKVSPSKLDPYSECAAYEAAPSENDASKEGELLHEILQSIIEEYCKNPTNKFSTYRGLILENHKTLTAEQINSIDVCIEAFEGLLTTRAVEVYTEEKLTVYDPAGNVVTFGFVDLIIIAPGNPTGLVAYIFDWKFGRNLVKPASVNKQGFAYNIGILHSRKDIDGVQMMFIQPRALEKSVAYFARDQLSNLTQIVYAVVDNANAAHEIIEKKGIDALTGNLAPRVNSYCRFCARIANCPSVTKASTNAVAEYHNLPALRELSNNQLSDPAKLASMLFIVKKLEPVIEAVKAAALQMAKQGCELEADVGGKKIQYELRTRAGARSINSLPGAYEVIKDTVPLSVVMSCASIKIGELEDRYVEFRVQKAEAAGEASPTGKKKFTKKDAGEEFNRILREHDLINGDGHEIAYLKEVIVEYKLEQETKKQKTINV